MLCPVCGMAFAVDANAVAVNLRGKDHHVCSSDCARKLRSNPPRYGVQMHEPKRGGRR